MRRGSHGLRFASRNACSTPASTPTRPSPSVVGNLVHNAVKFTKADGQIVVRASASADQVSIDVEDECGGLPSGKLEELAEQRANRRKELNPTYP